MTSRCSTNVEWVRFTCCYGPVLRREAHTLSAAASLHSLNRISFDGVPVNVSMGLSHQVVGTKLLHLRLSNQVIWYQIIRSRLSNQVKCNLSEIVRLRFLAAE